MTSVDGGQPDVMMPDSVGRRCRQKAASPLSLFCSPQSSDIISFLQLTVWFYNLRIAFTLIFFFFFFSC